MTRCTKSKLAAVYLIPLLLASVRQAHAQGAVAIQSAAASANQTVLNISGANFCALPAVTLGGTGLSVTNSTATTIAASLPALTPGTYYLVVSCGTLAGKTAYFDVAIGSSGTAASAASGCFVDGQRYADCGNGTVTDSLTGLIWLKDANCAALGVAGFAAGNTAGAALHSGQCGLTDGSAAGDWRLPTRAEWLATLQGPQSLIAQFAASCPAPPLKSNDGTACFQSVPQGSGGNQHAFVNVVAGGYWSSSVYELDGHYAYLADLSQTDVSNPGNILPHFQATALTLNVWPVRNGSK
jgi:hypothetical protein